MKFLKNILSLLLLLGIGYTIQAEKETLTKEKKYELKLKNGSFVPELLGATLQKRSLDIEKYCFDSYYYAVLQFNDIPSIENREVLKSLDVHLGGYLPERSYLSKIPASVSISDLEKYDVRSIIFLKADQKISPSFDTIFDKIQENVDVIIYTDKSITLEQLKEKLTQFDIKNSNEVKKLNYCIYGLSVTKEEISRLAKFPFVYFIESKPDDPKPLNSSSTVQTRSKYLQRLPGLTGSGVTLGMAEHTYRVNHIDMKGRVSNQIEASEHEHASHVTGIAAGNGNINPDLVGQAPNSNIIMLPKVTSGYESYNNFIANNNLSLVCHSYGGNDNIIGGDYNSRSYGADTYYFNDNTDLIEDRSYFLNVYACGNSGNATNYPDGWFTVVDGMNVAKNTLAVGALYSTDIIMNSSSQGPTHDGRLKPELMAEGAGVLSTIRNNAYGAITGTSMAAPAVTGGAALLTEAYKNHFNGDRPKAALLKALMCNTADDLGEIGPDYKHGFGRANFRRAYECISSNDKLYDNGSLMNGGSDSHIINVTNDVKELNVTLYWVDPPAEPLSNPTLKNDLNLTLVDQSGDTYYPWLLDPSDPAAPAIKGSASKKDNINNIEKITIKNPLSGNWTVNIDAIVNEGASQEYFVVYEFRKEGLKLSTPLGGESFEPGETIYLTWEAVGDYSKIQIEYKDINNPVSTISACGSLSTNGWNFIDRTISDIDYCGDNLSPTRLFYNWIIPPTLCNTQLMFRITGEKVGGKDFIATGAINIIPDPDLSYQLLPSENKFKLRWDPVIGADLYEIYKLQKTNSCIEEETNNDDEPDQPMSSCPYEMLPLEINGSVAQSTSTEFEVDGIPSSTNSEWYSVRAIDNKDENGDDRTPIVSERAYALEVANEDILPVVNIQYYLEGPYNPTTQEMSNALYERGLLPGMTPKSNLVNPTPTGQPYNRGPWFFSEKNWNANGRDEVGCNANTSDDVDWVLVTFREVVGDDVDANNTIVAHKAVGMLQRDGEIKFKINSLLGKLDFNKSYYIIVEHRNHLPVMSHMPINFDNNNELNYDFRIQDWKEGEDRLVKFSDGKWAAMAGNFLQYPTEDDDYDPAKPKELRNEINGEDKIIWAQENGVFDYYIDTDTNLDGDINGEDKEFWFSHNGVFNAIVPQCEAYAGTLSNRLSESKAPAHLRVIRNGSEIVPPGHIETIVLASYPDLTIKKTKEFPSNDNLVFFASQPAGSYSIHRFICPSSVDTSALQPGVNFIATATSLLNQGAICGDIDLSGIQFIVTE